MNIETMTDLLSINDMIEVENISGHKFSQLDTADVSMPAFMRAVVFVVARKTDPSITLEKAGDMKMTDLEKIGTPVPLGGQG